MDATILGRRFCQLIDGKGTYKAVTAVARELTGFVWAALMTIAEER